MYHTRNRAFEKHHDPCGQFQWMDYELSDGNIFLKKKKFKKTFLAANNGESVYIIGHIPPSFEFWW